jgi:hypothetical protein
VGYIGVFLLVERLGTCCKVSVAGVAGSVRVRVLVSIGYLIPSGIIITYD